MTRSALFIAAMQAAIMGGSPDSKPAAPLELGEPANAKVPTGEPARAKKPAAKKKAAAKKAKKR